MWTLAGTPAAEDGRIESLVPAWLEWASRSASQGWDARGVPVLIYDVRVLMYR